MQSRITGGDGGMNTIDKRRRIEELFQILELPNRTQNSILENAKEEAWKELKDIFKNADPTYLIDLCLEYRKRGKDGVA